MNERKGATTTTHLKKANRNGNTNGLRPAGGRGMKEEDQLEGQGLHPCKNWPGKKG
jgi:hypothetical protein